MPENDSALNPGMPLVACWGCGKYLPPQDRYCRYCGRGQGAFLTWYYRPWGIVVLTLLALGPFGLVLVWRSPRLSLPVRLVFSAAIVWMTVLLVQSAGALWNRMEPIMKALQLMGY